MVIDMYAGKFPKPNESEYTIHGRFGFDRSPKVIHYTHELCMEM